MTKSFWVLVDYSAAGYAIVRTQYLELLAHPHNQLFLLLLHIPQLSFLQVACKRYLTTGCGIYFSTNDNAKLLKCEACRGVHFRLGFSICSTIEVVSVCLQGYSCQCSIEVLPIGSDYWLVAIWRYCMIVFLPNPSETWVPKPALSRLNGCHRPNSRSYRLVSFFYLVLFHPSFLSKSSCFVYAEAGNQHNISPCQ